MTTYHISVHYNYLKPKLWPLPKNLRLQKRLMIAEPLVLVCPTHQIRKKKSTHLWVHIREFKRLVLFCLFILMGQVQKIYSFLALSNSGLFSSAPWALCPSYSEQNIHILNFLKPWQVQHKIHRKLIVYSVYTDNPIILYFIYVVYYNCTNHSSFMISCYTNYF